MAMLARHFVHQRKMATAFGGLAFDAVLQRFGRNTAPLVPFRVEPVEARVSPPPRSLIRDFVRHVGGDSEAYEGLVPPHLFSQWSLPIVASCLRGLSYPLLRIVNGGCRLEVNAALTADESLDVHASLESVEQREGRAVLHQRIVTSQAGRPRAVVADIHAVIPTGTGRGQNPREPLCVPVEAKRIDTLRLDERAGLDFALLTGDFNPIHWLRPYARALGFDSMVLHGFASQARVFSGLERELCRGAVGRLRALDVRFRRPLCLPANVGLYVEGDSVFLGDNGQPAYLIGSFTEKRGMVEGRGS